MLRVRGVGGLALAGLIAIACAPGQPPAAQPSAGQQQWDDLVAAARQEGMVVLGGAPPIPETRQELPEAFRRRFGVEVEYLATTSPTGWRAGHIPSRSVWGRGTSKRSARKASLSRWRSAAGPTPPAI